MSSWTIQRIDRVLENYPMLGMYGFPNRNFPHTSETWEKEREELRQSDTALLDAIEEQVASMPEWNHIDSYLLKHLAEQRLANYVTNGQMILVLVGMGFRHFCKDGSPNAVFEIDRD